MQPALDLRRGAWLMVREHASDEAETMNLFPAVGSGADEFNLIADSAPVPMW